jgi:hypothetical protein
MLLTDGNSNMKDSDLRHALQGLTLREVILERHGSTDRLPIKGTLITLQLTGYGLHQE